MKPALFAALLIVPCSACSLLNQPINNAVNNLPPTQPADLTDRVSGNYKGQPYAVLSNSPECAPTNEGVIEIGDATLYFAYAPNAVFIAPVQQDGYIHARAGTAVLDGTVKDGRLRMKIKTPVCETWYDMRWVL